MPAGNAVWGIDIGQCALKALRCGFGEDGETIEADAFDYIEYPKILSQPDAEPDELIRDALKQFLSRNTVKGDKVAISVSGQSGLARFIKLPPVEAKKIPDIVKYEAKQQIPFELDEVIWDYQQIGPGAEEEGFALESEVGLFAMKRDQVFRSIAPFVDSDVELDVVQLTPICIYNAIAYELLDDLPAAEDYDPEAPPESLVVLSMGTDTTDMVVTNGFRVWQRSIPLGGNHFTRQLTKELKLTFAKAEHLKRNAMQAENAKAIFQAMRPTFNDMITQVQRSLSFFQSLDKAAKIGKIVALGNAARLPGLLQYMGKNLNMEITRLDEFGKLEGAAVTSAPAFKENLPSFVVSYGLALQGLGEAALSTSLLPREILTQRLIRAKKPWAVGMAAALLFGFSFNYVFNGLAWSAVHPEHDVDGTTWSSAQQQVETVIRESQGFFEQDAKQQETMNQLEALGLVVVGSVEGRQLMVELLQAIDAALPRDPDADPDVVPSVEEVPLDRRPDIFIDHVDSVYYPDLKVWFNDEIRKFYQEGLDATGGGETTEAETAPEDAESEAAGAAGGGDESGGDEPGGDESGDSPSGGGPSGDGWIIEIRGHHLHNNRDDRPNIGGVYVTNTLLKNLAVGEVNLPGRDGTIHPVKMADLGISYPTLVTKEPRTDMQIPNPDYKTDSNGVASDPSVPEFFTVERYSFTVQFCWKETRLTERMTKSDESQDAAAAVDGPSNE